LVCKYSRDGDTSRLVVTLLGSPQAVYFKCIPEGLQRGDGLILYDSAHFDSASRVAREAAAAEQERRLAAARAATPIAAPSVAPMLSGDAAKAFAVSAPRPEYPYEVRSRKITGSGVVLMIIDVPSGSVTEASMVQSTGSPILDNAAISAFRRWRFKPGTVAKVRMPYHLYYDWSIVLGLTTRAKASKTPALPLKRHSAQTCAANGRKYQSFNYESPALAELQAHTDG
jgi:TonB family protein